MSQGETRGEGRPGFKVIDSFSRTVRLGAGVGATGALSEEAMVRAIDALKICAGKIRRRRANRVRCIATQACRAARNGNDFIVRVKKETGLDLDVVTAAEEARLATIGCMPLVDADAKAVVIFDIGGGSTELIWVNTSGGRRPPHKPLIQAWSSLPDGVVTLTERFGHEGIGVYEAMVADVRARLDTYEAEHGMSRWLAGKPIHLLGTSGTVTTLAGYCLGLQKYDRSKVDGSWLRVEEVQALCRKLAGMSAAERAADKSIGAERADLILAGCAIFEALSLTWPAARLRVADRGLREGILLGLMAKAVERRRGRRGPRRRRGKRTRGGNGSGQPSGPQQS